MGKFKRIKNRKSIASRLGCYSTRIYFDVERRIWAIDPFGPTKEKAQTTNYKVQSKI
jgi:hypothetical protein